MRGIMLLFLTLLTTDLIAQEGIQFQPGNWQDALSAARKADKLIFVDAYTSWCGPCKMMSREIFPLPDVGAFYNANFINVKMDMEKGDGPRLSGKYQVRAYPTFLFIDSDGMLVHRAAGYRDAENFIELAHAALDPARRLSALQQRFEAGERNPAFLYNYAFAAYEAFDGSHKPVVDAYVQTQDDWTTFRNMEFAITFTETLDSPLFAYLIENPLPFQLRYGEKKIVDRVKYVVTNALFEGKADLNKAKNLYRKAFPEEADRLVARFRVDYHQFEGELDQFAKAAVAYFDQYPSDDADELNDVAWDFYQLVEDKSQLKKAVQWSQRSVDLDDNYNNNDTLAALSYNPGQNKKAKTTAEHAIERAKQEGVEYSHTQELLQFINAM